MDSSATTMVDPQSIPIDQIDVSDPKLYQEDAHWPLFERLRREDPVHYCADSAYGAYWSVTRYEDIVAVDSNHKIFSAHHAVMLDDGRHSGQTEDATVMLPFLAMDPPEHDKQRKIVTPAMSPANIAKLEATIRRRVQEVLDMLPIGAEFDWVPTVSIELTAQMLATLVNYPLKDRHQLVRWSDVSVGIPGDGVIDSWEQRDQELKLFAQTFLALREERRAAPPTSDLISLLAHSPEAQDMSIQDYISNVILLIVGGNDTTRNSMSGSILALHDHPEEWAKLNANPALIESMVPEIIRFQTPLIYMGRRATQDVELGGKLIRKGDKVAMWYISGNRDSEAIEHADRFIIDRPRPRQHLSFGFGIHRCVGNRLAEMQLRILWEEILKKGWKRIEVTGPVRRAYSNNIRGIVSLPVRIHA
ncbi:Cytochrome P450 [Sphingobium faniae]|nr:Cytochrome P450 [Sphingobium faniae]